MFLLCVRICNMCVVRKLDFVDLFATSEEFYFVAYEKRISQKLEIIGKYKFKVNPRKFNLELFLKKTGV